MNKQLLNALKSHGDDNAVFYVDFVRMDRELSGVAFKDAGTGRWFLRFENSIVDIVSGQRDYTGQNYHALAVHPDLRFWVNSYRRGRVIRAEQITRIFCRCGAKVTKYIHGSSVLCDECYNRLITTCSICSSVVDSSMMVRIGQYNVCPGCVAHKEVFTCNDCGKVFLAGELNEVDGKDLCNRCFDKNHRVCVGCGGIMDKAEGLKCHGGYACTGCSYMRSEVKSYGFKPKPVFQLSPKQLFKRHVYTETYGFELEVGMGTGDRSDAVCDLNEMEGDWLYFKDDASIPGSGFEIVSHPFTMEFFRHKNDDITAFLKKVERLGYQSHNVPGAKCGLHVHVNKRALRPLEWMKLDFLLNNHRGFFKKFARRESTYGQMESKPLKEAGKNANADRFVCLNFQPAHTNEFRLWRGTLKASTFIATVNMCAALVDMVRHVNLAAIQDYDAMEIRLRDLVMGGTPEMRKYGYDIGMFRDILNNETNA